VTLASVPSLRRGAPAALPCGPSVCVPPGQTVALQPAVTFDLSTLGLVPPFHVEGP